MSKTLSPICKLAVVPPSKTAALDTFTKCSFGFNPYFSMRLHTTKQLIIFVKLAISLFFLGFF